MSIQYDGIRHVPPCHPGEMLREDFMPDYGLTAKTLANALGISRQTVQAILQERRSITPLMALRLSRLFGNSPEFWLRAQQAVDLWYTQQHHQHELEQIHPIQVA